MLVSVLLNHRIFISKLQQFYFVSDSCYYYSNSGPSTLNASDVQSSIGPMFSREACISDGVEARSPLAATRANSGASAASPIGTASCMKVEPSLLG